MIPLLPACLDENRLAAEYEERFTHLNDITIEQFLASPEPGWYRLSGAVKCRSVGMYRKTDYGTTDVANVFYTIVSSEQKQRQQTARVNAQLLAHSSFSQPMAPELPSPNGGNVPDPFGGMVLPPDPAAPPDPVPNGRTAPNGTVLLAHVSSHYDSGAEQMDADGYTPPRTLEGMVVVPHNLPYYVSGYFSQDGMINGAVRFFVFEEGGTPTTFPPPEFPRLFRAWLIGVVILWQGALLLYLRNRRAGLEKARQEADFALYAPVRARPNLPEPQVPPMNDIDLMPLPPERPRK